MDSCIHEYGKNCVCVKCGEENHRFDGNKCLRCGAVKKREQFLVSKSVPCVSCGGGGGDFDMGSNNYSSYCSVCGGSGIVNVKETHEREYIEYRE